MKLNFAEVCDFAARGATIGSCAQIELYGVFIGHPEGWVSPEFSGTLSPLPGVRAAREVYELDETGKPTGRGVWLPLDC